MDIHVIVNKTLRDMKQFGIISEENAGEARKYLELLALACWEQGTKYYGRCNGKKIIQYDRYFVEINDFPNQLKASFAVGYSDRAINRALKTGKMTRAHHYWRYAE